MSLEVADPVGSPGGVGVESEAHHPPALGPLLVELVELSLADPHEVIGFVVLVVDRCVVELDRIRHRNEAARLRR